MPRIGRAKYHSVNLKSNTGRGGVVSSSGFMGRGLVIRRAITRRSACGKAKCIIGMRTFSKQTLTLTKS